MEGELGRRIRAARAYGGVPQTELARKLGISVGTLIDLEKGRSEPPELKRLGMAAKVEELTGVDEGFVLVAAGQKGGQA